MFNSIAVLSLLTTAAFAQSSSGTATSTASSLIPTGISSGCSTFLQSLNSNSDIESCMSPIISATSSFASGSAPSASQMSSICSTSMCDGSTISSALSSFAGACSAELTSNPAVTLLYDALYVVSPMKTALCAQSDSGSYCLLSSSSNSSSSSSSGSVASAASDAQKYISTSDGTLNGTTFSATNLPFMFLQSSLSSAQCTTCTRNIMTAYINTMSNIPYAPGTSNSVLLSSQPTLYQAVTTTCGSNFLSGAVQAAGGLGTGSSSSSNGSLRSFGFDIQTASAVIFSMLMALML